MAPALGPHTGRWRRVCLFGTTSDSDGSCMGCRRIGSVSCSWPDKAQGWSAPVSRSEGGMNLIPGAPSAPASAAIAAQAATLPWRTEQ